MQIFPGSSVDALFYDFTGQFPPLYYKAGEGSLKLASVNAGNSNGLCVGLGGINGAFHLALTKAGQSNANLDPQPSANGQKTCSPLPTTKDDYQGRHQNLLKKAGDSYTASESYDEANPTAFSYLGGNLLSSAKGWYDGICFVDTFDPALRPSGNPSNVAMLYVAPPYAKNYPDKADFLAAIKATASNMIETVAGYNSIAAENGQPIIEALRNCLYSSDNYKKPGVASDEVARAIYAGLEAGLRNHPDCGLKELQFPINPTGARLFDAVKEDTDAGHGTAGKPSDPFANIKLDILSGEDDDDDDDEDGTEMRDMDQSTDAATQQVQAQPVESMFAKIGKAVKSAMAALRRGNPSPQYDAVPRRDPIYGPAPQPHAQYDSPDFIRDLNQYGSMGGLTQAEGFPPNVTNDNVASINLPIELSDSLELRAAKETCENWKLARRHFDAFNQLLDDGATSAELKTKYKELETAAQDAADKFGDLQVWSKNPEGWSIRRRRGAC